MPVMSAVEGAFCRSKPWRAMARRWVLPWALDGHRLAGPVLEIGGGSGAMAEGLARTHPDVRLTGTDVDDAMVDAAQARLAAFPNVTLMKADVTCLGLEAGHFDVVASYLMLHHVIDWGEALGEVARVLKPGGRFLGYDLTDTRLARAIHRADGSPHRIVGADELAEGLALAGFIEIDVSLSWRGHLMRFRAHRPG